MEMERCSRHDNITNEMDIDNIDNDITNRMERDPDENITNAMERNPAHYINGMERCLHFVTDCLYHSARWRYDFQFMINQVYNKLIPAKYIRVLIRRVCVCKTEDDAFDEKISSLHLRDYFMSELASPNNQLSVLEPVLSKMLKDNGCTTSLNRLLSFIQSAGRGDFSELNKYLPKCPRSTAIKTEVKVALPYHLASHLIGKRGVNLKTLCKVHNVFIKLQQPNQYMYSNPCYNETSLLVTHKNENGREKLQHVKNDLISLVKNILTIQNRKLIQRRVRDMMGDAVKNQGMVSDMKDANRDTFSKKAKYLQSKGCNRMKKQTPAPVLSNSRCINCLITFTTQEFKSAVCTHHAGYLVGCKWSCCGTEIKNIDQVKSHEESGCTSGIHNWRPVKSSNRKNVPASRSKLQHELC